MATAPQRRYTAPCAGCGAPVTVTLSTSKSITCGSCNSLIDLSAGIGGELKSAKQHEPVQPLIPVGSLGELQGSKWQVVGFQHGMGLAPGDDEHFGRSEYLLYHQKKGFCFLVDSEEGWSLVRPITGAPKWAGDHAMAVPASKNSSQMGGAARMERAQAAIKIRALTATPGAKLGASELCPQRLGGLLGV